MPHINQEDKSHLFKQSHCCAESKLEMAIQQITSALSVDDLCKRMNPLTPTEMKTLI